MTDRKKNISNIVKTIIRQSTASDAHRAKSMMSNMAKDKAKKEDTTYTTPPPVQGVKNPDKNVTALEELKLNEIAVAQEAKSKELLVSNQTETPKQAEMVKEPTMEEISIRAYLIWEREGRPDGCSDRHWQQAVQELKNANN